MKRKYLIIGMFVLAVTFVNAQSKESKKEAKAQAELKEYEEMKVLVNSEVFMFTGEWANSQNGKRINLMGNPTYLKLDKKIADGYLPFFGTAQTGGYGAGGAIEFKGNVENYTWSFDDKKQKAIVKFKAKGDTSEYFDVTITVFRSLSTTVNINSSSRSTMSYNGRIKTLEKALE
jgi:hypothetical protein